MAKLARSLALLATTALCTPAFAQPGAAPPNDEPPPVHAGAVIIVTPSQPALTPSGTAPGQAPAATPAPQTQPWSNVSHVNGQLVKIGEHHEYLYDAGKKTIIATNPIGWMFGFYGISVSQAVSAHVAIRGDANWFNFDNSRGGYEVGLSAPIYFRRTFSGPFLEPGVVARNLESCSGCTPSSTSAGPEVLFGWHWSFDSGLNVAMALGAMKDVNNPRPGSGSNNAEPVGYFRIGYAM
jgi:hypothetical protein